MKRTGYLIGILIELVVLGVIYYFTLPAMNLHSTGFWAFVVFALVMFGFINAIILIFD